MMRYGQSPACRWKLLLEYFGEVFPEQQCGCCDNCLHPIAEQLSSAVDGRQRQEEAFVLRIESSPLLNKGTLVMTPSLGTGRLEAIEADKVVISFPRRGTKKFKRDAVTLVKQGSGDKLQTLAR